MKRILTLLFCLISLYSRAQMLQQSVVADTLINDEEDVYNFITKKCIKLHDNTILFVRLKGKHDMVFNSTQYDSIQVNTYTQEGIKITSYNYLFTNKGGYIDDVAQTTDGTVVLVAEMRDSASFIFLDSTGYFLFSKTYPKADTFQTLHKLYPTKDNRIIVYSQTTTSTYAFDCFMSAGFITQINICISKIDLNGNILWEKQLDPVVMYQSAFFGRSEQYILKMNAELDVSNTTDNSFNIIKYSKDSIYGELKIEYLHLDTDGNILNRKFLARDINNDWCFYNSATFKILNDKYRVIEGNYASDHHFPTKQYDYDINGILLDSVPLSDEAAYYQLVLMDKLHYTYFNEYFIKNNLVYWGGSSWPNTGYERTYNLSIDNNNWSTNVERDGFAMEGITLIKLNDSTLLYINIVDSAYFTPHTKTHLIFHTFSLNDNQIFYSTYIDRNNNGTYDTADTIYNQAIIETSINNETTIHRLDNNGHYNQFLKTGNVISRLVSYEQHLKYFTVTPMEDSSIITSTNTIDSVFFRLTPKPGIQDLQVSIIPITRARPGLTTSYKILAKNAGTATIRNIQVKFLKDNLQTIDTVYNSPYSISGDTIVWNIDSLEVYRSNEFMIRCLNAAPPTLNTNDTLHLYADINPVINDSFINDNIFYFQQVVINSADPNDKTEAHGSAITLEQLSNREYLYYTIRFQNTGNSYASNIIIKDTLASTLDWSTFEMLSANHNYTLNIQNRRNVTWSFNGIHLPDSTTDEINSHGYIFFRIKPAVGLTTDASIYNRAAITFDYNLPIYTNTVTTNIIDMRTTGIKKYSTNGIKLFPIPATNFIQIEFNEIKLENLNVQITDIQGNQVYLENIKTYVGYNTVQLNVSHLPNGIYFIQLNDGSDNLFYGKIVKQ